MHPLSDPQVVAGTWRVERAIKDRRAGERHAIDGSLVIAPTAAGLSWEESLVWHRADGDVAVRRGLLLVRGDDGWWVRFADGRDFHPWRPGQQVVHPCDPDTYAGRVEGTAERWQVTWDVAGPAKDYTMTTVLTPLSRRTPG